MEPSLRPVHVPPPLTPSGSAGDEVVFAGESVCGERRLEVLDTEFGSVLVRVSLCSVLLEAVER